MPDVVEPKIPKGGFGIQDEKQSMREGNRTKSVRNSRRKVDYYLTEALTGRKISISSLVDIMMKTQGN